MTTLAKLQPLAPPGSPLSLDDFFDRLRSANPFTANRVNGPAEPEGDVSSVHQAAFERLRGLAREARDQARGLGAVLWGEAGIGKSHLLARLARWAEQDEHALLIYLHNLQASPANLPRSLVKAVISILTRGRAEDFRHTPLFRLVYAAVYEALNHDTSRPHPWDEVSAAFDRLLDRLAAADGARAALVYRRAYRVLFQFFRASCHTGTRPDPRLAALAVRWLSGDPLDRAEARLLGLAPAPGEDVVALADNQQIKQVLVALAQLALFQRQPFVLCLDQVDNLDEDQVAALSRFLEALLDSAPNLLVVTAGVQASLLNFRAAGVIQASAWDRVGQFEIALQRVSVAEGRRIVADRLDRFLQPFRDLEPVRQCLEADPLFPLGKAWAEAVFKDRIDLRPRDVLNWAREGWRRQQEALREAGGPAWLADWGSQPPPGANGVAPPPVSEENLHKILDDKIEVKIQEHRAQREANRETLPADADKLSRLAETLLKQCLRTRLHGLADVERPAGPRTGPRPGVDLVVRLRSDPRERDLRVGLLFLVNPSTNSTTNYLRRLLEDDRALDRLFLVTDERQPLQLGTKGAEYLEELRRRKQPRFRHLELTFSQVAELDALLAVIGLARSGDLEVGEGSGQVRRVTEQEVIASYQRRGRYLNAAVVGDVLGLAAEQTIG